MSRSEAAVPKARRLILLLDGTWNDFATSDQDTNIVRLRDLLAEAITPSFRVPKDLDEVLAQDTPFSEVGLKTLGDFDYLFFYERGVGTGPGLDRLTGGALGWGLERNIRRAYKFLSRNFVEGSEIFVFGFSRGAYTARSLVGYLGSSGLLRSEFCDEARERLAWSYYRTVPNDRLPETKFALKPYVFPIGSVRVACLGVFDTVGALGIPATAFMRLNRERYEFHDVELSPIVRLNLQALAIDEHRLPFAASIWRQSRFRVSNSVTEQTWFPGVHADIGGGYLTSESRGDLPRAIDEITLDWMIKRVRHHYPDFPSPLFAEVLGLEKEDDGKKKHPVQHESRKRQYLLSRPALRSIGNLRPRLLAGEQRASYDRSEVVVGESIHISALERLGEDAPYDALERKKLYAPRNVLTALASLKKRYSGDLAQPWESDTLSVTAWNGEIVYEQATAAREEVKGTIEKAIGRMTSRGVNLSEFGIG
jgi:hypothetical protein